MKRVLGCLTSGLFASNAVAQNILADPGTVGPIPEIVFLYDEEWPTGIAVSSKGRKFSNYPPFLNPTDSAYTVAELKGNSTQVPYPNAEIQTPPGGRINTSVYPPMCSGDQDHFVGVQSVVIDPADRLWILDTGRASTSNGTMVPGSYGGPKLLGVDLDNDQIFTKIIFDPMIAPADSYLNDIRIDLDPSKTASGQGIAYITDSSPEGRNALVIVDLGTGQAWRRLVNAPQVSPTQGFVPTIWGHPIYTNGTTGMPIGNVNFGADGIALSPDGKTLWFSTTGGRGLYSIATAVLRDTSPFAELRANGAVQYHGEHGVADGMETDSNGIVYAGNMEDNSIGAFDPSTGVLSTFVRDPRFSWTDTLSVATDGYLYFTENQLWRGPAYFGGKDMRVKPFVLFRAKLPGNGTKITQSLPA